MINRTVSQTILRRVWNTQLHPSWRDLLAPIWGKQQFQRLDGFLDDEYEHQVVLPDADLIFNAFNLTPFDAVRVVILSQDPYPNPEFAHGLAFSVAPGVRIPLSLLNVFKEISGDLHVPLRTDGSLLDWAQQGVLLLNTILTVRSGSPGSHADHGWELFTDRVITLLSEKKDHLVFLLWGAYAIRKSELIDASKHLLLCSSHPSFRSFDKTCGRHPPFLRSYPFSRTNAYLEHYHYTPIVWTRPK